MKEMTLVDCSEIHAKRPVFHKIGLLCIILLYFPNERWILGVWTCTRDRIP